MQRHRFDPRDRKIPWRRKWQPTPVFLPGTFHGRRTLVAMVRGLQRAAHNGAQCSQHSAWVPAALRLELAVFFFCHPGENIIVHHYGFNLHSSFKKWFSIFFLELSIQNLSLGQEEGKSWKGGSGFYWFIVLHPFWIWILCLTYIGYTPNIFLSLYVLPFHSLDNVLWWREILNFRVIRCIHFAIYG